MKILLTGSSGMVGRNITEHPKSINHKILKTNSKNLNLLDKVSTQSYIDENKPDIIIHAAGIVGGIQANTNKPASFLSENLQMGLNILTSARNSGVKKFMNLASSCMYPRYAENPLFEDMILKGELEPTNEPYALAKVSITRLCEYINREDESYLYKTVIPCNLYGKYDKFDPEYSHMIPAVIRKIHNAKFQEIESVEIWGDGSARREFMYAADFADFIFHAIDHFNDMPQNINVGLGYDFTIDEFYKKIANIINYQGSFLHNLSRPIGMKQKLVDISKLKDFGWQHRTTLEQGIRKTYDYFLGQVN